MTLKIGKKFFNNESWNCRFQVIILSVFNSIYNLGYDPIIIKESKDIKNVNKLIIPGVGSAFHALSNLNKKGFIEEIKKFYNQGKPILGICLGLQIFAKKTFRKWKFRWHRVA